jgi:hypothetical protein
LMWLDMKFSDPRYVSYVVWREMVKKKKQIAETTVKDSTRGIHNVSLGWVPNVRSTK